MARRTSWATRKSGRLSLAALAIALIPSLALLNGGTSFGSSPISVTVTCTHAGNGEAAALVSWSSASNLGTVYVTDGLNRTAWFTSARSGSFEVAAEAFGPSVYVSVELYSRPDKTGSTTRLAYGYTPDAGCGV